MNMTEQDWESILLQHKLSLDLLSEGVAIRTTYRTAKPQPVSSSGPLGSKEIPYLFVGKLTAKAKFYVTHECHSEVGGFWVPKSIIVREEKEAVHVKEWFRINIVKMR